MAVVVGHVVDEYVEVAQGPGRVADRGLQCTDISDVGLAIPGRGKPGLFDLLHQCLRGRFGVVDERDLRSLSRECLGHASANSRATAGDENAAAAQGGVAGVR